MTGVGSIPALATCETSQVLLASVSGGFPGVLPFRPTYRLARLGMSEIIFKGTLNSIKKKLRVFLCLISASPSPISNFSSNLYSSSTFILHSTEMSIRMLANLYKGLATTTNALTTNKNDL